MVATITAQVLQRDRKSTAYRFKPHFWLLSGRVVLMGNVKPHQLSEPILNASFKGGEGEGRGPTIEPDFRFVLDRVGRWSLDDVE
jgi:hypothetical protein